MTTLVDDVSARIDASVPALAGRIEGVADLAALIAAGALPQREVAAFVVPLGFDDRGGESVTSAHTQVLEESVAVILCIKALGDAKARRALPTIEQLSGAVIAAVAGWAPGDVAGVFRVTRGRLLSAEKGLVIYQIDFALLDQLRIVS
ncbi:phage tail terminator protein [Bradyrhizobium sp. HKCCYLR20261]|uniref:phage tail terminator protein n=1 Tax=Bradyrhizobium sp. HKCCYLR20261 TaxID=3420760 RepID=UPI003EBD7DBE